MCYNYNFRIEKDIMALPRINYLSNKELLSEIEKSKASYSVFLDEDSRYYDVIIEWSNSYDSTQTIEDLRDAMLSPEIIQEAIVNRQKKLKTTEDIPITDLVFRVMTFSHVPKNLTKIKKNGNVAKVRTLNFPPFIHFKLDDENNPCVVGKSHWTNGLHNGEFSMNHGQLSNTLAVQIIKLVERFATKGNWRGYSYIQDMSGDAINHMCENSLKFHEMKGSNAFAYMTQLVKNSFRMSLKNEKKVSDVKDKIMVEKGYDQRFAAQDFGED